MEFLISVHCVDSKCPDQVVAEGFTSDDSGLYVKQNKTGKFEDSSKGSNLERPVYRHESLTHRCIWWHKPYRHWWIGECTNIFGHSSLGGNNGFAWLAPDSLCPIQDKAGDWRRGGSDEPLEESIVEEATLKDLEDLNNANQGLYILQGVS